MMSSEVMNPWKIQSIYDLLYFHCPSCDYINQSKQQFVNHAFDSHPNNTIGYLSIICDGSLDDVVCPWDIKNIKTLNEKNAIVDDPLKIVQVEIKQENHTSDNNDFDQKTFSSNLEISL